MWTALARIARELGIDTMSIASGAYDDAMNLVPLCPKGMLFVPCERGQTGPSYQAGGPSDSLAAPNRAQASGIMKQRRGAGRAARRTAVQWQELVERFEREGQTHAQCWRYLAGLTMLRRWTT